MSNPYLARLQAMRNPEKRHHEEPSKPSKLAFEGFEGDHECHVLENHCLVEGGDVAVKNSKNATPAYPQNVQNPSAPTDPDGTGCKIEIVELPQAGRYRKVFGVLQLRPPENFQRCFAAEIPIGVQHSEKGTVGKSDPPVMIKNHDPLAHCRQYQFELLFLIRQCLHSRAESLSHRVQGCSKGGDLLVARNRQPFI